MSLTIGGEASKNLQTSPLDRRISLNGWTLAIAVTLLAAFLFRIWELGSVPAALHPDELAGYAGTLDELTGRAPLRAFFDYRIMYLPLYGACEFLSSLLFGTTAVAFRFPAALFGVTTVWCTIGLTRRLLHDRTAALLAGVVAAFLPWNVVISRVGWEPAAMLPFVLGGLWLLRIGLEDAKVRQILLAGVLFGIGSYSYRAALPESAALCAAMVLLDLRRARSAWRPLLGMAAIWCVELLPLVISVVKDPSFFWRDHRISTFADGVTRKTLALFANNYSAHFLPGPLFRSGDGNPNHGPRFGVLYPWMLPWMIFGALAVWPRNGFRVAAFLWIWLLLYPLGGALTNDGVPHFLRTLIGAPIACIFTAIGLLAAWDALARTPLRSYRAELAWVLSAIATAQLVLFCRAYFIEYVGPSADANQYENRELFAVVRRLERSASRVCFEGINGMNSQTLFAYYLRSSHLEKIEGLLPECFWPQSIVVTKDEFSAPPGARLAATAENYEGRVVDYVYVVPPKGEAARREKPSHTPL